MLGEHLVVCISYVSASQGRDHWSETCLGLNPYPAGTKSDKPSPQV